MLWIALAGRDAGMRCSQLLGIRGETAALDLDLACAMRLLRFDNERSLTNLRGFKVMMIEAIGETFGGKTPEADNEEPEFSENDVL